MSDIEPVTSVTKASKSLSEKATSFYSSNKKWILIALAVLAVAIIIYMVWGRTESFVSMPLESGEYSTEGFYVQTNVGDPNEQKKVMLFYAPWCPHCKSLMEGDNAVWTSLAESGKGNVGFEAVNCDENPDLSAKFEVKDLPTIKLVTSSGVKTYKGDRSLASIEQFIYGQN